MPRQDVAELEGAVAERRHLRKVWVISGHITVVVEHIGVVPRHAVTARESGDARATLKRPFSNRGDRIGNRQRPRQLDMVFKSV